MDGVSIFSDGLDRMPRAVNDRRSSYKCEGKCVSGSNNRPGALIRGMFLLLGAIAAIGLIVFLLGLARISPYYEDYPSACEAVIVGFAGFLKSIFT